MCLPISIVIIVIIVIQKNAINKHWRRKIYNNHKIERKILLFETETKAPKKITEKTHFRCIRCIVSSNFEIRLLWTANSSVKCGYCGNCSNCVFVLIFCYGYSTDKELKCMRMENFLVSIDSTTKLIWYGSVLQFPICAYSTQSTDAEMLNVPTETKINYFSFVIRFELRKATNEK